MCIYRLFHIWLLQHVVYIYYLLIIVGVHHRKKNTSSVINHYHFRELIEKYINNTENNE